MSKWSLFFLLVPILGVAVFAVAPALDWDLPENVSTFGEEIDFLYNLILVVTGITFIATNAALVYILWRFGREGRQGKADYMHGSRQLEILWTVIPAILLLFIALYQMPAWIHVRFPSSKPNIDPIARVVARQFEWRMVYPGPDGLYDTVDDVFVANELHMVKNARTLIDLRSMDVLHSFFVPNMRIKQDAVPGLAIPVWFDAHKSTREFQAEKALFETSDVLEPGNFIEKIHKGADPVSAYLKGQLSKEVRRGLEDYDPEYEPDDSLVASLVADLNDILAKERVYAPERFAGVKLSESARELTTLAPAAAPIRTLWNRQLLDSAYPDDLRPLTRHYELVCAELCGWGHYKMKGRVIVHDTREELNAWLSQQAALQEASK